MNSKHSLLAACTVAVSLSIVTACAVGPNYHRPPAATPAAFKEDQGWKPATPGEVRADQPWWSIYEDPLLDSLERQIEVSNQTLKADEAAYRSALEAIAIDRGQLFPTIGVTASVTRSSTGINNITGNNTTGATGVTGSNQTAAAASTTATALKRTLYSAGAQADWSIDVWGRIRRLVESDVAKAQASAADVAAAKLSAQIALAEDYFQLRTADQQARLYSTDIEDFQNALTITQNQVKAGITTLADVYQAETELESTQAAAVSVQLTRAKFEHAIAVLTGKPPSELSIAEGELATRVPVVPAGVPSSLLERRPDIASAERSVASANALIGVAEAAWFPTLTLNGSYGFSSSMLPGLLKASNSVWSFGPSIAETVFNGGTRLAQTRQARDNYEQAVATYRQTVLSALQSVEDDLASLRVLEHQGQLQQTALKDARSSESLVLNQYKSGIVGYTNVITAQTTRLGAEISLLSIQSQALVSSVDLISQLGGGWDSAQLRPERPSDRAVPPR